MSELGQNPLRIPGYFPVVFRVLRVVLAARGPQLRSGYRLLALSALQLDHAGVTWRWLPTKFKRFPVGSEGKLQ